MEYAVQTRELRDKLAKLVRMADLADRVNDRQPKRKGQKRRVHGICLSFEHHYQARLFRCGTHIHTPKFMTEPHQYDDVEPYASIGPCNLETEYVLRVELATPSAGPDEKPSGLYYSVAIAVPYDYDDPICGRTLH